MLEDPKFVEFVAGPVPVSTWGSVFVFALGVFLTAPRRWIGLMRRARAMVRDGLSRSAEAARPSENRTP